MPDKTTTDPDFEVTATASSGLDVTIEVADGPATISGNTVSLTGETGYVTLKATQSGNSTYNPAPMKLEKFRVSIESQPGIVLTYPYENTSFQEGDDITLSADVSLGNETLNAVEFYEGSNKLGELNGEPYSYEWLNVNQGSYTLWAKLVTNEGTSISSNSVDIEVDIPTDIEPSFDNNELISVHPNPTSGIVKVETSTLKEKPLEVEVLSIFGNSVSRQIMNKDVMHLDLTGEPAGIYYIKVGESIYKVIKD